MKELNKKELVETSGGNFWYDLGYFIGSLHTSDRPNYSVRHRTKYGE
ncbi:hypothetical protein MY04_3575 [Flammeovirga sp. MY04]|nr:hypothetical protein [Flammeovirga sp. MY04]ANQ50923.1 hypothetical protein MY04_3575 [Flammeovirga sp. MY04]